MKDLNEATAEELERTAQIDGTRARYIIEHRQNRGPFESWEDVKEVPSFEDGMIERLQHAGFDVGEAGAKRGHRAESPKQTKRAQRGGAARKRMRTSEETSAKKIELAKQQGRALEQAIHAMDEETGNLQLHPAGDYVVGCTVEEAEGLYEWRDGRLEWTEPSDENAHIEIVVCDAADGRFVPGLDVTVTVRDENGEEVGRHTHPLLWHPWLPHYGRNWVLPDDGEYTIAVHIAPLKLSRHDKANGGRFARPVDVAFSGVEVETGRKTS